LNTCEVVCDHAALSIQRYNPHEVAASEISVVNNDSERSVISVTADGSGLAQFVAEFDHFLRAVRHAEPAFVSAEQSIANAVLLERVLG
jgi:predicted dehydrogenase